jgi:hypothetical protein
MSTLNRQLGRMYPSSKKINPYAVPILPEVDGSTMSPDYMLKSRDEGANFRRGIHMAIGIETVAAICLYALWRFIHFS